MRPGARPWDAWPRPTGRGVALLVACALTAWLWQVVRIREVLELAVLEGAALGVALAWVAVGRLAGLAARVEGASDRSLAPDEEARVEASMRNRLPVPVAALAIWRADGRTAHARVRIGARASGTSGVDVRGQRRGVCAVELARVGVADPLSLFTWSWPGRARARVTVLPRLLAELDAPAGAGPGALAERRGEAGQPGGSLRDYRAGDALRRIHWKQTARQGKLLVHEPESGSGRRADLVLVTDPASYPDRDRGASAFELAVSVVATLARDWLRAGAAVRVLFDDPAMRPLAARDEGTLLRALAEVGMGGSAREAAVGEPGAGERLVVTGRVAGRAAAIARDERGGTMVTTDPDEDAAGTPLGGASGPWRIVPVSSLLAGSPAEDG